MIKNKNLLLAALLCASFTTAHADIGEAATNIYEGVRGVVRDLTGGDNDPYQDGVFTKRERDAILRGVIYNRDDDDYNNGKGGKGKKKDLPPGLQKKVAKEGQLPPGWQKKMARGEVMDSSVYQYRRPIPRAIYDDIRIIAGTEVIQVEDKVVRVLEDSRKIIDVIDLVTGR